MFVLLSKKTFGSLRLEFGAANVLNEKNIESLVGSTNITEPIPLSVIAIRQTSDFLHHFAGICHSVLFSLCPKVGSAMMARTDLSPTFLSFAPSI
jgi:hypothetical protein